MHDFSVEADHVADRNRLLELEGIHRNRCHAAPGTMHGGNRAGHVYLRHDPATEDIAVLVEIGWHRHRSQGRLLLRETDTVDAHDLPTFK